MGQSIFEEMVMKLEIVNHNGACIEPVRVEVAGAPARPLRGLAVVGLGYWGPNWIRNFSTLQCAERLVACDLSTGAAVAYQERLSQRRSDAEVR